MFVMLRTDRNIFAFFARKLSQYHNITPANILASRWEPIELGLCTLTGKLARRSSVTQLRDTCLAASWGPSLSASPFADRVRSALLCVAALLRFPLLISGCRFLARAGKPLFTSSMNFLNAVVLPPGTPRRDLEFPLETRAKHAAQRYFA